ncbi:MAG TPA: RNA-binding protein [Burkholderiales bacterium]|nr:RNA-binding protein [Burkholderiales bacterium]
MDNKKLFVASLSFKIRDAELESIFSAIGPVLSAKVILDRDGRSKGFGFVEMESEADAERAIQQLNGSEHFGRPIVVNKQKPQEPRTFRPRSNNSY